MKEFKILPCRGCQAIGRGHVSDSTARQIELDLIEKGVEVEHSMTCDWKSRNRDG